MKIKVCGLREYENVEAVSGLAPDFMGFIFYSATPRYVDELSDDLLNNVPETVSRTAVFVNEKAGKITEIIDKYSFDAIQLHGNESPEFCELFRQRVKVIKAFGLNKGFDFDQLQPYARKIDFFLFDTKTDLHGGSGKSFDWEILQNYKLDIPFFLSGGLSLDNLEEVKAIKHQQFYGVDLNSKFEISPGLKDIDKLKTAFALIKNN